MALAGLDALHMSAQGKSTKRTPAQESHFLCSWMAESLKTKRFSKLVADDLSDWIRQGRSMGAGANLKALLAQIVMQYQAVEHKNTALGTALHALVETLQQANWLTFTDTDIDTKLKLDSDGKMSLIVSASELKQHIQDGELIKPITLFVRGDEQQLAKNALEHGLLLSQGNKKTSLIKHHKAYRIVPNNQQSALALLTTGKN